MNETLLNQLIMQAISDEVESRELTVSSNDIDGIRENVSVYIEGEIMRIVEDYIDDYLIDVEEA